MLTLDFSKKTIDCVRMLIPEKLITKLESIKEVRIFGDFAKMFTPFVISISPETKPVASSSLSPKRVNNFMKGERRLLSSKI